MFFRCKLPGKLCRSIICISDYCAISLIRSMLLTVGCHISCHACDVEQLGSAFRKKQALYIFICRYIMQCKFACQFIHILGTVSYMQSQVCQWRHHDHMVSVLNSGLNCLGSSPAQEHCVTVFLSTPLNSLPFTWKKWLVYNCSKWYASIPKWNYSRGCGRSLSSTFSWKIGSKAIQAKRPGTSKNQQMEHTFSLWKFHYFGNFGLPFKKSRFPKKISIWVSNLSVYIPSKISGIFGQMLNNHCLSQTRYK